MHETPETVQLPPASAFPRQAGPTPPGTVLSYPDSPSLAAAVALAAGRFQPLLHVEPMTVEGGLRKARIGPEALGFGDAPTEAEAVAFAPGRIADLPSGGFSRRARRRPRLPHPGRRLALSLPSRLREGPRAGKRALDDLIGRVLPADPYDSTKALLRWAYTGRILGDPPASVYRAMAALFLQPETALFWDTYDGGRIWDTYAMTAAATTFGVIRPETGAVVARSGDGADLASWHRLFQPVDRFELLMMNSSGAPGSSRSAEAPADLPTSRSAGRRSCR